MLSAAPDGSHHKSIQRRGKFIVMQLDEGTLTVHLGMTGRLLLDAAPSKHSHGVFTLDTGSLIYTDPRQFGRILWNHDLSRLGPEPLDIGLKEFQARMKLRKTSDQGVAAQPDLPGRHRQHLCG